LQCGILVALPLVHAARHNDVKPKLGRELMILTHDDDDDVCMYVCMYRRDSQRPCTGGCGTVSESKADRGSLGCSKHGKTWKSFV
jgi:hypothetical protein